MILSFIIINRKYIFHYYFNHHHLLTILFFFLLATHLLFLIHPYQYKNQIQLVFHSSIDLYKFARRANKKLRNPLFYRLYIHHHTFYHHSLNIIIYIYYPGENTLTLHLIIFPLTSIFPPIPPML